MEANNEPLIMSSCTGATKYNHSCTVRMSWVSDKLPLLTEHVGGIRGLEAGKETKG